MRIFVADNQCRQPMIFEDVLHKQLHHMISPDLLPYWNEMGLLAKPVNDSPNTIIACTSPHQKKTKHEDKKTDQGAKTFDPKGKKQNPYVGLMPNMVGEKELGEDAELMRAWVKVRD